LAEQKERSPTETSFRYAGQRSTQETLALLLGRNEETLRLIDESEKSPLTIEFLLQGTPEDKARGLAYAREVTDGPGLRAMVSVVARVHAEFWAGSSAEAFRWAQRALRGTDHYRERESVEEIRMRGDRLTASVYQVIASDLLDTRSEDPEHVHFAVEVLERLRA